MRINRNSNSMRRSFVERLTLVVCLLAASMEGAVAHTRASSGGGFGLRRLDDSPAEAPAEAPAEDPAEAPAEVPTEDDREGEPDDIMVEKTTTEVPGTTGEPNDGDEAVETTEVPGTTGEPNVDATTTPPPDTTAAAGDSATTAAPESTEGPTTGGEENLLGDPSPAPSGGATEGAGDEQAGAGGDTQSPTTTPADPAPEPTTAATTEPPQPTVEDSTTEPPVRATPEPTASPVSSGSSPVKSPVAGEDNYWDNYTPPTDPPVTYEPPDDDADPVKEEPDEPADGAWIQEGESPEEMMHDRNVLIAAGVLCGVALLLMIITAHQMVENPDGCCASVCRLLFGCTCCIFRTICFPCRAICGCGNKRRSRQHQMINDNGNYTHDLELS